MLVFCANIFAQISGYLGKRLSLEYNNAFFSALNNPTNGDFKYGDDIFSRIFSLNTRNNISLDYVVTRRTSIGVGFEFFKTRYALDPDVAMTEDIAYIPYGNEAVGLVSARCYNFHFTRFSKQSIAPLGNYSQFDLGYIY